MPQRMASDFYFFELSVAGYEPYVRKNIEVYMKIYSFGIILFSSITILSTSVRSEEKQFTIEDYNQKFISCAKNSFPDGCVQKIFSGRLVPWMANQDTVLEDMGGTWKRWLGERKVFAVHREPAEVSMQIFATQKYIIERDDGQIDGVWFIYRKRLGTWVLQQGLSGTGTEFIFDTANLKNPRN